MSVYIKKEYQALYYDFKASRIETFESFKRRMRRKVSIEKIFNDKKL